MKKDELKNRIEAIANEANSHENGYHYEVVENDWENYGKSRTYFKIVETRENSKHYTVRDYGFYDNIEEKFVPGKASIEYTFSGTRF